jgi:predicted kinase
LEEAKQIFSKRVHELLEQRKNMVLDRSFYAKQHRDEYRAMVEQAGGSTILVYLHADREVLWKRICDRRKKELNADSAREISLALLEDFVRGFEVPVGEGELFG